jgi:hypothetical protein
MEEKEHQIVICDKDNNVLHLNIGTVDIGLDAIIIRLTALDDGEQYTLKSGGSIKKARFGDDGRVLFEVDKG